MVVPIVVMLMRAKYTSHGFFEVFKQRPMNIIERYSLNYFGVKWKVLYGTYGLGEDAYAFVDGDPLCPNCDYEMKAEQKGLLKRYYWKCDKCGKSYKVPVSRPYDARGIVERLLESEMRKSSP
jgi:ribosomal protein L37AE/L43A